MIDEIYFSHTSSTQGAIRLDRDTADYLIDDDGLDWGSLNSKLSIANSISEHGAIVTGFGYNDPRTVTIVGWVVGTQAQMELKKQALSRFLSSSNEFKILIPQGNDIYQLDVWISENLKFDSTYKQNNEVMCRFTLAVNAPYPFFTYTRNYSSQIVQNQPVEIENKGDFAVGLSASFSLTANTTDPTIQISASGRTQTMYLDGDFSSGDVISINTKYGRKGVFLNSASIISRLRTDSDWIKVPMTLTNSPAELTLSFACNMTSLTYDEPYAQLKGM